MDSPLERFAIAYHSFAYALPNRKRDAIRLQEFLVNYLLIILQRDWFFQALGNRKCTEI